VFRLFLIAESKTPSPVNRIRGVNFDRMRDLVVESLTESVTDLTDVRRTLVCRAFASKVSDLSNCLDDTHDELKFVGHLVRSVADSGLTSVQTLVF